MFVHYALASSYSESVKSDPLTPTRVMSKEWHTYSEGISLLIRLNFHIIRMLFHCEFLQWLRL